MKKFLLPLLLLFTFIFSASAQDYLVVGYIPTYSSLYSNPSIIPFAKVTHINIAFLQPTDATGKNFNINNSTQLTALVNLSHNNSVKVLISLAGALNSSSPAYGYLNTIISDDGLRATFENNIVTFINYYNLDGLDIDIETGLLQSLCTSSNPNVKSPYTKFLTELRTKLGTGKLLTAALGTGYYGNFVDNTSLATLDWINVMSYDKYGTWTSAGQHASYNDFVSDENYYLNRGIDYTKIMMGVPFYGYGWGPGNNVAASFAYMVGLNSASATTDYYKDPNTSYEYYYNGTTTMKQKALRVYNEGLAGIMIWELDQDAAAPNSLLDAIHTVLPLSVSDEQIDNSGFKVYPNPAKNKLHIESKVAGTYALSDIEGKAVLSGETGGDSIKDIQLPNLTSGMYILKFSSAQDIIIKKIVVE